MRSLIRFSLPVALVLATLVTTPLFSESPKLSKEKAQKIALKLHPGKVKSSELETEHGLQVYSFDIQTDQGVREVGIDANSGKVVEDSVESPADEAKEQSEEKTPSK
jgi:hypothetical protein